MKRLNIILRLVLIIFVAAFVVSFFNRGKLVAIGNIDDSVKVDPFQTNTKNPSKFAFKSDGNDYSVTPLYDYEISGIVVSKHDYNPPDGDLEKPIRYDLCMVWGRNVTDKLFLSSDISFSQSDRFCNYKFSKPVDFDTKQISNNHIVTTDSSILKKIESINTGDEIMITGMLVKMSGSALNKTANSPERTWSSSTTRTDTGAGACEVIYVKSLDVLASVHAFDSSVNQYSLWGIIAVLAIFLLELVSVVLFIKPKVKDSGGFIR